MQCVDGGDGCGDVGTLDVDIALGRGLVHVDVGHPAVLVALLDDVVPDLLVPVRVSLRDGVEHVGQHEALSSDGRQTLLLLLFGRHVNSLLRSLLDSVDGSPGALGHLHAGPLRQLCHEGQSARGAEVHAGFVDNLRVQSLKVKRGG